MESNGCPDKEPQKLYKIGVFSYINRITIKTLRYYDDIGLLKPAFVDDVNGYRYYTSGQLPKLHKILALREMDFSLDDIKLVFAGQPEEKLLQKKKKELLKIMADTGLKLAFIESYLIGDYLKNDFPIITKSLPEIKIASMRVKLKSYEDLFSFMPEMGMEIEKAGCQCVDPDYCFTIYYDGEYKESDIDAEICQEIAQIKEPNEKLYFRTLPAVPLAACVLHKGPYRNLPMTYTAIVQFMEESGYEIIGHQRESYIDGIWNKESEEEWLTEIQFPVRKLEMG